MIGVTIATILFPMIIVHLLFKVQLNNYWMVAEWTAGDVLGYVGDVLSFIGTIALGYIAIKQNDKANELNSELVKIEKNRTKPYLDINSLHLYKIFLARDLENKLDEIDRNDLILTLLHTSNPRGESRTTCALIELKVCNNGHSDIQRIIPRKASVYLFVTDPYNCKYNQILNLTGNNSLKVGESKRFYICFDREILHEEELGSICYKENIDSLLPRIKLEFELETVEGSWYIESLECSSSWDISMKNMGDTAIRTIGVSRISVKEVDH